MRQTQGQTQNIKFSRILKILFLIGLCTIPLWGSYALLTYLMRIQSFGTIIGYIYVEGNKFYLPNGKPIRFFGMNVRTGWTWKYGFLEEIDFQRMSELGINAIRLCISPREVEPNHNQWSTEYLDKMDQVLEWCAKYGIYVIVDYHIGASTYMIPTWMRRDYWGQDIWNYTMENEVNEFWDMISKRWKDNPMIIGYEIPWNEPNFLMTYSSGNGGVWATEPYLSNWRRWLEKKYGNIAALNGTWTTGDPIWDQYNVLKSSEGEDQFSGILLPYTIRTNQALYWKQDLRMNDFSEFVYETWYNKTRRIAQTIRKNDQNHLLIFNTIHAVYHRILMNRYIRVPPEFEAIGFHNYVANFVEPTFSEDSQRLKIATLTAKQMYMFNRSLPVLDLETVDNTPLWGKAYLLADYANSLQGTFFWCLERVWNVKDPERPMNEEWTFLGDFAKIWKDPALDRSPKILFVSTDWYASSRMKFLSMLREHSLEVDFIPDGAIASNPSILENYKIAIVQGKRMLNETVVALKQWISESNDRYLLLLGMVGDTPYHKDTKNEHWGLWEGHIVKDDPSSGPKAASSQDGQEVDLSVSVEFGGLAPNEIIEYKKSSSIKNHNDFTAESDYDTLAGSSTIIWDNTNNKPAMWIVNRTAYFYDLPDYPSEGFEKIILAWLKWTQQVTPEDRDIYDFFTKAQNYLAIWECNNRTSSEYYKVDVNVDETYVIYNHTSQEVVVETGSDLQNGLRISLSPYDYRILTFKSASRPTWIYYDSNGIIEENYDDEQKTLTITVTAPRYYTTTLKIYMASIGEPMEVQGADSWTFDPSSNVLTVTVYHENPRETIIVS